MSENEEPTFVPVVFSGDSAALSQMLYNGSVHAGKLGLKNKFNGKEQPGSTSFTKGLTRCCSKLARAY